MSDPFVGQITLFGFNFAPYGWMQCNGQTLPVSQYAALFSLLGTYYGGNGTSTFQLPNLQGTVPVSMGNSTMGTIYDMGEQGGVENVTLTASPTPPHTHLLNANTVRGTTNTLANNLVPSQGGGSKGHSAAQIYAAPSAGSQVSLAPAAIGPSTGSSLPHETMQPTLTATWCIAMQGVFPPRS